ncbi:hypothetical protein [Rhodoligotrophos defluvii]|uniref:hypothetical protein n=1 Tax=Rhodoligotrophos defluvii TaxID=2561934 RepID=UPI0010C98563|nr:hypothetical protein [Rhodoligotrophos defluvii]
MQQKSADKEPYYLRYGEPVWYRDEVEFPKGRDPRHDLFADHTIDEIAKAAREPDFNAREALQADLREVAYRYLTALYTTPLRLSEGPRDVKLTRRVQHLERNVIKPAEQLLDALSDDNAPLLSEWPEDMRMPAPDRAALRSELEKLRNRAEELRLLLTDRIANTNMTTEFLTDLGNALSMVLKRHFPRLTISRGTHIKTTKTKSGKMYGTYLSVMEICVREILPKDKLPSSSLIGELRKLRGP